MTTVSTEPNPQLRDADTLMLNVSRMRSALASVRKTDPGLADHIEAIWKDDAKAIQSIMTRGIAARLILGGMYDNHARRIAEAAGEKAVAKIIAGALPVPDSVKQLFDGLL